MVNKNEYHQYQQLMLIGDQMPTYHEKPKRGLSMKIYTKESLIDELKNIRNMGWIPNARKGNSGGIGNTLEDLLEIEENNLPIPNAAEWELKCQRLKSNALITLFHMEPSPRALKFVPQIFLPNYGWQHKEAGKKYSHHEKSFRQTISGHQRSDRGFTVEVQRDRKKITISFDSASVDSRNKDWLLSVEKRVGLDEINPQPYWGFDDLRNKAGTKLLNCFYILADTKRIQQQEYFNYSWNQGFSATDEEVKSFVCKRTDTKD